MKISFIIPAIILGVIALSGYASHSAASNHTTEDYQQITISKKLFDLLTEKKVNTINAISATDDDGNEVYIDLAAVADLPDDMGIKSAEWSESAESTTATCPPLYPGEPTNCIWIGWKAAGYEGGQYLPYHCHCYR